MKYSPNDTTVYIYIKHLLDKLCLIRKKKDAAGYFYGSIHGPAKKNVENKKKLFRSDLNISKEP